MLIFGLLPVVKINFSFAYCTLKVCIKAKKKNHQNQIFFPKMECTALYFDLFYSMKTSFMVSSVRGWQIVYLHLYSYFITFFCAASKCLF